MCPVCNEPASRHLFCSEPKYPSIHLLALLAVVVNSNDGRRAAGCAAALPQRPVQCARGPLAACPMSRFSVTRDQLFLLPPTFPDPAVGPGNFHCIECARIEGLLSYQPELRTQLDVQRIPHARPRVALIQLLGEPYQNCPTLVLASPSASTLARRSSVTGRHYCTGVVEVTAYLVAVYGVSAPHP